MKFIYNYYSPEILTSISLKNDQVRANIYLNTKHNGLDIEITNLNKYNRKKIDVSYYLNEIIKFLQEHTYMVHYGDKYTDLFNKNNVKRVKIEGLKIEDKDVKVLSRFTNLYHLRTYKCTFYKDCNLGVLKCNLTDKNSDLYSLDSLNCFSGDCVILRKTHIVRMNKNILHLNNQVLELFGIKMNYELFLLTTDAPNMRRLNIYRCPQLNKLKNRDLLFISGFYNLEGINIDGVVDNYDQFDKLERLRKLKYVLLSNVDDKYKEDKYYKQALQEGLSDVRLANYLCNIRLFIQNNYFQLRNELYVPRLKRVRFEGMIKNQSFEEINKKLIDFYQLDYKTRKNYLREPKKRSTLFDDMNDLVFDKVTNLEEDEEYYKINSRPFDSGGIDYYVKSKKIIIDV